MNATAAPRKHMRLLGKHALLSVLGGLAMVLAMTGAVDAYWTTGGTGTGSGPVGTLAAPTSLSGTPGAGTVALSWDPVEPLGAPAVSYFVNGAHAGCPMSKTTATTATFCTDSGLIPGTYSYTVTAVWQSWTATSPVTEVTTLAYEAANKLVFTTQPTNTAGGATISSVAVTVQDIYGNTVTSSNASVTIAIGTNPASGTLSGTTSVNAVAGVATFSTLSINHAGTGYTLSATSGSLTGATSTAFDIIVGAASKLAFTTQPGGGTSSTAWTNQPTVTIQDAGGNTVTSTASVAIAIGTNPAGGTLSGTATVSAVAGVATFSNLSINTPATGYTLTAASSGLAGAVSSTFNITAGAANKLVFTTQPTNTAGGATISSVAVTVQDIYGNTVTSSNASVTIAIGNNPAGGTLFGTTTVTAAAGVATFSDLSINHAGTGYTLSATSGSLTGATSTAFDIIVGAASKLAFTTQPTNTVAGAAITPAVTVTVQDAGGNTVTNDISTVTLTIKSGTPTGGGPGSLTDCSPSESNGVVTFSGCKITTVGTGYKLHATDGTLTPADSTPFNITGAAVSFTISTPGAQTAGTPFSVSITAKDAYGNTATGYTGIQCLTFSGPVASPWPSPNGTAPSYPVQGSCPSLGQSAVTFTDGVAATVTLTLYNASSSTILTATDASLTGSTDAFTVSAAAEAGIMLSYPITTDTLPTVGCLGSIGVISCSSYDQRPGANDKNVLVAGLTLEDKFGNVVTNTGSSIVIDLVTTVPGSLSVSPATNPLSIVNGYSAPFTLTRANGNNKTVTMTATVRVNGTIQTQTLTVTLSS